MNSLLYSSSQVPLVPTVCPTKLRDRHYGHWGDGEFAAVNHGWADTILGSYIHGAAAVESIAMDGRSIGSKVAAAVTHNSDSQ